MSSIELTNSIFDELQNCTFECIKSKKENDKKFKQNIDELITNFQRKASEGYLFWEEPTFLKTFPIMGNDGK